MADIIAFEPRGAHTDESRRRAHNDRVLGRTPDAETPELYAITREPWYVDLSDPDLIAFAKSGGPIIPAPWDSAPGC